MKNNKFKLLEELSNELEEDEYEGLLQVLDMYSAKELTELKKEFDESEKLLNKNEKYKIGTRFYMPYGSWQMSEKNIGQKEYEIIGYSKNDKYKLKADKDDRIIYCNSDVLTHFIEKIPFNDFIYVWYGNDTIGLGF